MKKLAHWIAALLLISLLASPAALAVPRGAGTLSEYTVEHYRESILGTGWELAETETLQGYADTYTKAEAKIYEGFLAQPFSQTLIAEGGGTTVRINYVRNSYVLIWYTDGDPLSGTYTSGTVKFGAAIRSPETPTKQGYTFSGWSSEVPSSMPAAYTVFTAQWTPNSNTPYAVLHYRKDLEGSGYTLMETEHLTGTTAAYTSVVAKALTGFTSLPFSQAVIAPDGSTSVSVYYDRNSYNLVWNPEGGTLKGNYTSGSVKFGAPIVQPAVERNGYDFAGWNTEAAKTMPAAFTTYSARWTARPFYIQTNLNGGTLAAGESNPTSYTSESPAITLKNPTRTGYTFLGWIGTGLTEPTKTVTIPHGSQLDLTFSAVWQAERYPVTLHPNDGTILNGNVGSYTVGIGMTLPTELQREGYDFGGWYANQNLTGSPVAGIGPQETGAKEYWAKWTPRTGVGYLVRHYKQKAVGSGYEPVETEALSGVVGTKTAAVAKAYPGFTAKSFDQEDIAADGSTVISILYDRNFFTLSWDPDGGALSGDYTHGPTRYGAPITQPTIQKDGFRFDGWYQDTAHTIPWDGSSEPQGSDLTLYAKWVKADELRRVQVKVFYGSEEGSVITDAEVRLMQGDVLYRSLSCVGGVYSASDVADGDYNVSVTSADGSKTVTKALRVDGADPELVKVVLPLQAPSTVTETSGGAPAVTVSGLEEIAADPDIVGPQAVGVNTQLKLLFSKKQDLTAASETELSGEELEDQTAQKRILAKAIADLGADAKLEYYDVQLLKITTDSLGNSLTERITDTGDHLLTITVSYSDMGRSLRLYRDHVNAAGEISTVELNRSSTLSGTHSDGSYYQDDRSIVLYFSRFSAVAIAYEGRVISHGSGSNNDGNNGGNNGSNSGGNSGSPVRVPINVMPQSGGTVLPAEGSAVPGTEMTVTVQPDSGYVLDKITILDQNGDPLPLSVIDSSHYTFTVPEGGATIHYSFLPTEQHFINSGVENRLITEEHIVFLRGFEDGTVRPNGSITRAEIAMIFYRLLKDQKVTVNKGFTDVAGDAWYAEAVNTLASLGILNGVGEGLFEPDRSITRAEFTAVACRFANAKSSVLRFSDVPEDHWAAQFIASAASYGWINGYGDGRFGPEDTITRAQAVAIVNRMLDRAADKTYVRNHRNTLISFPDLQDENAWYYFEIYEAANAHSYTKSGGTETWTN